MDEPKYKRVLLKISGEALAGEKHFGLDFGVMGQVADVIKECVEMGVQVGIVIGGGNFWRGVKNGEGYIERTRADHMGMLATAMNCMAMADVLEQKGVDVRVQTALEIKEVAEPYIRARAIRHLEKGRVVIFGCGIGSPFFSTENWKRPAEEVSTLMSLLKKYMQEAIDTMERDKMKLRFFGDLSALSPELQDLARRANAVADRVDGFQANLCINYGGRDEILHAAKLCAAAGEEMTEENLEKHLYSAGIPDPELIIRPGGELRLSNFLLWQCAYSEFYFCDTLWPDFGEKDLDEAIVAYQQRDRRFGGVK